MTTRRPRTPPSLDRFLPTQTEQRTLEGCDGFAAKKVGELKSLVEDLDPTSSADETENYLRVLARIQRCVSALLGTRGFRDGLVMGISQRPDPDTKVGQAR